MAAITTQNRMSAPLLTLLFLFFSKTSTSFRDDTSFLCNDTGHALIEGLFREEIYDLEIPQCHDPFS